MVDLLGLAEHYNYGTLNFKFWFDWIAGANLTIQTGQGRQPSLLRMPENIL